MKERLKGRKRLAWIALAAMMAMGLWWNAAHSNDGRTEEARRIIVYSTTS
ncbi:hypothetical protein ACFPPD_19995 [Cohnella suwonensis]|uniref:Uncharacterized protein n=1 Tax=Cohnella suwonensis TaxID=696072 RepID=A0ABW0LYS8_9BACL